MSTATVERVGAAPETRRRTDLLSGVRRVGVPQRFAVCAALAAPVLLLAWFPLLQFPYWPWVALALAAPVAGWGALPLHRAALAALGRGAATPDTLASLTVLLAVGLSVQQLVAGAPVPGRAVPLTVVWGGGSGGLHLDVAVAVTTAVLGVRVLSGERDVDRIPAWFVPAVLLTAAGAGGFWFGAGAGRTAAFATALAVLVVSGPLALAIAEPCAVLAARRAAAWRGTVVAPDVVRSLGRVTTVLVGTDALTRPGGLDRVRPLGLDPVLLTADPADAARAVADRCGVDTVVADLSPAEQAAAVDRLRAAGGVVAAIGGARPVLAAADVGIAVHPAVHPDAADVAARDPDEAADLLVLGRRCGAVARAGVVQASVGTAVGVGLAAVGLLHPTVAVAVLGLGAVLVAVRSLTAFHGAVFVRPAG